MAVKAGARPGARRHFLASGVALAGATVAIPHIAVAQTPFRALGIVNVKDYGAIGNFITDDTLAVQAAIDAAFGPASSPNGVAEVAQNKILHFPPGRYRTTAPLNFTHLVGSRIVGSGRFVTTIENSTPNQSVIVTNGCAYTHWEGLRLKGSGSSRLFDLNWDGSAGGAALQSNNFTDIFFDSGHIGIEIGRGGFMGSENLFLNCFWLLNSRAGLLTSNYNALQNTVTGGNFQTCGVGIWIGTGSVTSVQSVGFQQSVDYDIRSDGSVGNCTVITGCRSESVNFVRTVQDADLSGCTHTTASGKLGDFVYCLGGNVVVSACMTNYGRIHASFGSRLRIQESTFKRPDWLFADQLWSVPQNVLNAVIELENVSLYVGSSYSQILRRRLTAAGAFEYALTKSTEG
jgi:hypothetical protein